ncbi:biotin transporter BioY [Nitratireductor indicus]|uniref:biotin transporter BioY n=1 Tax=Nitratireductor indicus TaxID=721133 RepID=UPI002875A647|nr:biotin transporter BioY [Nitratireductor indicus]MDS1137236.1 biotin transporter BioY [Nitratireductor indicus]
MSRTALKPFDRRLALSARMVLIIVAGAVLMTIAAKVQIPFWPVPMTLHTMAVMAFAAVLGPRIAVSIFLAYLAAGAVGLPVFSGWPERGIGFSYMVGPTGGYLLGYLIASWLVGVMAAGKGTPGRLVAMLAGMVPVYAIGMAWLALYVPVGQLLAVGALPFLLGDIAKIAVVAVACAALPATVARLQGQSE